MSNNLEFVPYKDNQLGISIEYPSNWETSKYDETLRFTPSTFTPGKFIEALVVERYDLEEGEKGKTLEEIAMKEMEKESTINESTQIALNGYPAFRIVYTYNEGERKVMQICSIRNGDLYLLTYYSKAEKYDELLSVIKKMIDSFQFISA